MLSKGCNTVNVCIIGTVHCISKIKRIVETTTAVCTPIMTSNFGDVFSVIDII